MAGGAFALSAVVMMRASDSWRLVRLAGIIALAGIALSTMRPAAAADDVAAREINTMIEALGSSGCQFWRNGDWHDGAEARDHLRRKQEWARKRHLAGTAEEFIERAASRSSLSGKSYRVLCPGQPEVDSGRWFRELLRRIRVDDA